MTQSAKAASDGISDRRRDGLLHTQRGYPAPDFQVVDQFGQEERIAAGLVPKQGSGRARRRRGQLLGSADELGDRLGVQAREIQAPDAVEPVQFGQPGGEFVGAVRFGGAERGHHQHADIGAADQHLFEHREGGQLRPMQVVEDQRDRAVDRQAPQEAGERVEKGAPGCAVVRYLAGIGQMPIHLGRQPPQLGSRIRQLVRHRTRGARHQQTIQCLGERCVRNVGIGR